ncbi:MAG: hypothetical protein AAGA93_12285 [Actinomycetota bacterium]
MADDATAAADGDAKDATKESSSKRVELVDGVDPAVAGLPGYIGVGLLGGVALGFGPLRNAVTGNGPFEDALLGFIACLLVCLAGASAIGRLLDNAAADAADEVDEGDGSDGDGRPPTDRPDLGSAPA